MTRLTGKVKSIPVKEVTEGIQVKEKNYVCRVEWIDKDAINSIQLSLVKNPSIKSWHTKEELKTIVVEYEGILPFKTQGQSKNEKGDIGIYQLPLKYSQWQSSIDNGEVDSDKEVEFEKVRTARDSKSNFFKTKSDSIPLIETFNYAKIIPQKKKVYSEEDMIKGIIAGMEFIAVDPKTYESDAKNILNDLNQTL